MKYETASAFLMALKDHTRRQAQELGVSPQRLQKEIVFERLMARLLVVAPDRWVLKGGVALDFRYLPTARATRDLDLAWRGTEEEATKDLIAIQSIDLGDHFTIAVERKELSEWTGTRSASYHIDVEIGGHRYTSVVVDVGFGDALVELHSSHLLWFDIAQPQGTVAGVESPFHELHPDHSRLRPDSLTDTMLEDDACFADDRVKRLSENEQAFAALAQFSVNDAQPLLIRGAEGPLLYPMPAPLCNQPKTGASGITSHPRRGSSFTSIIKSALS